MLAYVVISNFAGLVLISVSCRARCHRRLHGMVAYYDDFDEERDIGI